MRHEITPPTDLGYGPMATRLHIPRISLFRWAFFVRALREAKRQGYGDFRVDVKKLNWFYRRVVIHCKFRRTAAFISDQLVGF